ncbi:anosmin-1a [Osmerus mordax]|uniref:anosmin-1a n=1 Tax=Osmerus mordax TaxID=8014 RepID=UPI00350FADE0
MLLKGIDAFTRLCLWTIFFLSLGNVYAKKQDDSSSMNSIFRARCASRCLSLHSTSITTFSKHFQVNGSLSWCQSHKQCAKCLEPCKDSWEIKRRSQCWDLCERSFQKKHGECLTSCEFLQSVVVVKQGECPPPEKASGFAAACVESCEEDGECSTLKKCCSNGCGHTCQPPKNLYKGAPLKPRKELIFQELPSGPLEVRWSSRFNVSADPVVYVLQRRWNYGIQPSEDAATPWETAAQTTQEKAWLADTRAGRWYQFRVAAVNIHGTRGFTTPSRHIHSRKDPSKPPVPSDLRVTNMTFGTGRVVFVRVQWAVSPDLDVPVHHIKVAWSWTATEDATTSSKMKRRKTVRGWQDYVDLDSLRANRSYSVEVQAVSYWGQTPLKSPKASLRFSTQLKEERRASSSTTPVGPPSDVLDVGTPFYQGGQLQVRVYWQSSPDPSIVRYRVQWVPEYCRHNQTTPMEKVITQENFISLPDLLFSCKYKVLLQPLGTKGRPQVESTSFFTPSCATIQAKSPKTIACPGAMGSAPVVVTPPKLSTKVENLTASFMAHKGNVTVVFAWELAPPPASPQLTGFQVTWAEVSPSSRHNNLPNSLISQSQILPPERSFLVVSGLRLATLYRLEVQVIGTGGEGPAVTRTFHTPISMPAVQHRPRLRKHHQQHQPMIERH